MLKINFRQHQMRHFSGKTGRKKREKKGKGKFTKHKWGKYSVKAHYSKYRFPEPKILLTKRREQALAHGKTNILLFG